MSTYTFAALSTLGRARPADAASSLKLPANVKRGLGMLATLSLTAGPAAAQATDAVSAPIDIGRIALAFGVLTAIALLKVWSYADKRGKLMDRLPGYLTSRAVHRARHASTRAQQPQRSSTATRATTAPSHVVASRGKRPASGFRVLPVPGLPSHLQYLSD